MIINENVMKIVNSISNLKCKDDFAMIVQSGINQNKEEVIAEIAFLSKFVVQTFSVMKRIGTTGEGYDKLMFEWNENFEKVSTLLKLIVKEILRDDKKDYLKNISQLIKRVFLISLIY